MSSTGVQTCQEESSRKKEKERENKKKNCGRGRGNEQRSLTVFSWEQRFAFQHLRENTTCRPNIDGDVVFLPSEHDFRSSVVSSRDVTCHLGILDSSEAEVADLAGGERREPSEKGDGDVMARSWRGKEGRKTKKETVSPLTFTNTNPEDHKIIEQ